LLTKAVLRNGLQLSMESFPASAAAAAQGWADAITAHVATGMSPQNVPPTTASINGGKAALTSSIASSFQTSEGEGTGPALASALSDFYFELFFEGDTPGWVIAVPGASSLGSALATAFRDNTASSASVAVAAGRIADAIHACTLTVTVMHIPPHYIVGPLT